MRGLFYRGQGMSRFPVSVCIIAKNEERYIGNCLSNLIKYGMEIIVVDTGSTDATVEIAKKYTKNVYSYEWNDDFSAARNYACQKASNNWILALDCDEYVTEIDRDSLRIYMQKYNRHLGVIKLKNLYTDEEGVKRYQEDSLIRLYNKNFYGFFYRIHEQLLPLDNPHESNRTLNAFEAPIAVEHHGYDISSEEMEKKQARNLGLLHKAVGENSENDDYIYFQIAQSHAVLKNKKEMLAAYSECFKRNTDMDKDFINMALSGYVDALMQEEDYNSLLGLLIKYRSKVNSAYMNYCLALSLEKCGAVMDALLLYTQIITRRDIDELGEKVYEIYAKIILLCQMTGNEAKIPVFRKRLEEYAAEHGMEITYSPETLNNIK